MAIILVHFSLDIFSSLVYVPFLEKSSRKCAWIYTYQWPLNHESVDLILDSAFFSNVDIQSQIRAVPEITVSNL